MQIDVKSTYDSFTPDYTYSIPGIKIIHSG